MSRQHGGKTHPPFFRAITSLSLLQVKSQHSTTKLDPLTSLGTPHHPAPPALGVTTAITNQNQSRGRGWKWVFERLFPAGICFPGLHSPPGPGGMGVPGRPPSPCWGESPPFLSPCLIRGYLQPRGGSAAGWGKHSEGRGWQRTASPRCPQKSLELY